MTTKKMIEEVFFVDGEKYNWYPTLTVGQILKETRPSWTDKRKIKLGVLEALETIRNWLLSAERVSKGNIKEMCSPVAESKRKKLVRFVQRQKKKEKRVDIKELKITLGILLALEILKKKVISAERVSKGNIKEMCSPVAESKRKKSVCFVQRKLKVRHADIKELKIKLGVLQALETLKNRLISAERVNKGNIKEMCSPLLERGNQYSNRRYRAEMAEIGAAVHYRPKPQGVQYIVETTRAKGVQYIVKTKAVKYRAEAVLSDLSDCESSRSVTCTETSSYDLSNCDSCEVCINPGLWIVGFPLAVQFGVPCAIACGVPFALPYAIPYVETSDLADWESGEETMSCSTETSSDGESEEEVGQNDHRRYRGKMLGIVAVQYRTKMQGIQYVVETSGTDLLHLGRSIHCRSSVLQYLHLKIAVLAPQYTAEAVQHKAETIKIGAMQYRTETQGVQYIVQYRAEMASFGLSVCKCGSERDLDAAQTIENVINQVVSSCDREKENYMMTFSSYAERPAAYCEERVYDHLCTHSIVSSMLFCLFLRSLRRYFRM